MTRVLTFADPEAAAAHAATELARALQEAVERRGVAHLSLAGGSTPRPAYVRLAGLLEDWSAVELWYGDERCVAPEDPESNHKLVADSLLAHIPAASRPLEHRIPGELGPEAAARAYEAQLRARVPPAEEDGAGGLPSFDLALLGLGEDGHDTGALCLPVRDAPKPPPARVTLSLPVLRAARCCLLLVTGAGKAAALASVLAGPDPRVPASLLASERLLVVADAAAAGTS
jgi:6-phosphogluconolactonase